MADPVIRPLVDRGLPDQLNQLKGSQRVGDGQSNPGPGINAARTMNTGALDASTAGGLQQDGPAKYAHLPAPMSNLIREAAGRQPGPQIR